MNMRFGRNGLVRTSVLAIAAASAIMPVVASAQDTPDAEATASSNEIVVTAQRRAEGIENVPISVAAFSQATLADLKIESTDDLQFATPGITNTQTAGDGIAAVFIRGVGTGYSGPGLEGSVAFYLDDIYLQTQTASAQNTIDIAQVEVLKGPQGTLYGRNATGGAVVVTTRDPELGVVEGYVKAGYGNLDWARGEAVLNVPMGDTFAIRAAGFYERRDGYVSNISFPNEKKSGTGAGSTYSARVKALWEPTPDFEAVATFSYDRRNGNGAIHALLFTPEGDPVTSHSFYQTEQSQAREGGGGDDTDGMLGSLRLAYHAGDWTISNTTAYRRTRAYGCTDNDGIAAEVIYFCTVSQRSPDPIDADGKKDRTFTNELRAVSEMDGPFNVTAGVFYERNKARFPGQVGGTLYGLTPIFDNYDDLTAWSAYLEGYYDLTDALTVTVGGRYTHEKKAHVTELLTDPAYVTGGKTSFNNFSPRFVLAYDAGDWNFYTSFNRGFKSGGFESPGFVTGTPLKPETISAFEGGAKYRSPDGSLYFSTAGYYYDWKNIQVAFITGGGAGLSQQNAAGAHIYGVEADMTYTSGAVVLRAGVALNHARYSDFPNAAVYDIDPTDGLLHATSEDLTGFQVQHAPDFTANGSATYNFPVGGWEGAVTLAGRYTSKYDFTAGAGGELRAARQPAHLMVNMTGSFSAPGDALELGWFVKNLTKRKLFSLISTGDTGVYYTPDEPRTYGVTATYRF